jgi:hypothetical protein
MGLGGVPHLHVFLGGTYCGFLITCHPYLR